MLRVFALGLALLAAGCQTAPPPAQPVLSDIELTWQEAMVALPPADGEAVVPIKMAALEAQGPLRRGPFPTVVYLHGCTGLGDTTILKVLAAAGYAVIAPDSMARRYRPLQCDPTTRTGGYNLFVYDFRQEEIAFAVHQMPQFDWIDMRQLYLVGASEGGVAAALYRGDAFRARVIAQWTCHGSPLVAGLDAPPWVPVLAIVRSSDPWYSESQTRAQNGDCGAFMNQSNGSRSLILQGGAGHDVLGDPQAQGAIVHFLNQNRLNQPQPMAGLGS
ncbi:dienelactone hydrolase family protein [Zavarzinia sp. CC-PAN008]|uniref:dienelactone hydrolase family protein n=1 Tax=Zavarzinia sp. CC-PAN008 TaxID=3243332 RepID=UPI003F743CED